MPLLLHFIQKTYINAERKESVVLLDLLLVVCLKIEAVSLTQTVWWWEEWWWMQLNLLTFFFLLDTAWLHNTSKQVKSYSHSRTRKKMTHLLLLRFSCCLRTEWVRSDMYVKGVLHIVYSKAHDNLAGLCLPQKGQSSSHHSFSLFWHWWCILWAGFSSSISHFFLTRFGTRIL